MFDWHVLLNLKSWCCAIGCWDVVRGLILSTISIFLLLNDLLISELLEFEYTFSLAIVESVTYEFPLELTIKYESKPCSDGFVHYYILLNKLRYNRFFKVSVNISDHIFWDVPIYCINIRAFTFDVPNVIDSRNNNWCKWGKSIWSRLFFFLIAGFIFTIQIRRDLPLRCFVLLS